MRFVFWATGWCMLPLSWKRFGVTEAAPSSPAAEEIRHLAERVMAMLDLTAEPAKMAEMA